jgi:hypothetical protein
MMGNGSSGPSKDHVFRANVPFLGELLKVVEDLPDQHHALVEPAAVMTLADYEQALAGTRPEWKKVWP